MSDTNETKGRLYNWMVVVVLSAAMAFSLIDRFVLSLLFEPIKSDLLLSDTQLGLLHGIAFGLFYATMGIPIAWLIDRWSRKWVIFWGIGCWSLMTALCGLARNYTQLLGARIGVGVGEAALAPAGYSMITDIIPRKQLGTAISVFQMGSLFGGGLAFLAGGTILNIIETTDFSGVILLHSLAAWQITFIAVALPGIIFMGLFYLIREPTRLQDTVRESNTVTNSSKSGFMAYLWEGRNLYTNLFIGNSCLIAISYGNMTWLPSILSRQHGWEIADIGIRFGLVMLIAAPIGVLLGGVVADRWESMKVRDAYPRVLLIATFLTTLLIIPAQLSQSPWVLFTIIGMLQFSVSMVIGAGPAVIQLITNSEYRGRVSAVYVFMVNIIGLGLGPVLIGVFSDNIFTTDNGVLTSLGMFSGIMCLISIVTLVKFRKRYLETR